MKKKKWFVCENPKCFPMKMPGVRTDPNVYDIGRGVRRQYDMSPTCKPPICVACGERMSPSNA